MNADKTADILPAVREALAVHFDPKWGTPFWLERRKELSFDPRVDIRIMDDLAKFGMMRPSMLRGRPYEDFVPRSILADPGRLITCQTGGTLGAPVWTVYRDDEFAAAFVEPFVAAASHVGFPRGMRWLYSGPTGPHVIGRAAEAIARRTGSPAPFTVDFDPRWAAALKANSFAATRYVEHIIRQAMDVINTQHVGVIFSTPVVLARLAEQMTETQRMKIGGVHYGGLPMATEELAKLQEEAFPNAVHLSGYGNSLFGCCLELSVSAGRALQYFPHGDRLRFAVCDDKTGDTTPIRDRAGDDGLIVFSRFDQSTLFINMLERDRGTLIRPPDGAPEAFTGLGIDSPTYKEPATQSGSAKLY